MRDNLKQYSGQVVTDITAVFYRLGYIENGVLSVLLGNVSRYGEQLTEHAWAPYPEELKNIDITNGDIIKFDAYIDAYEKKDGIDYGIEKMTNIRVIKRRNPEITVDDIKYFKFVVKEQNYVYEYIKGEKKNFIHDETREIQKDITIRPGDTIEIEIEKVHADGHLEYAWKIDRFDRWNRHAFFNPERSGQALFIYSKHKIFLPENIYFVMKDFYFKTRFTKPNLALPYIHDMEHYIKPDKFKHRYFINYDKDGNAIDDTDLINDRKAVYQDRENILNNMSDEDVINFFEKTYGNKKPFKKYFSPEAKEYNDGAFLRTKTLCIFNSSNVASKSTFVTNLLEIKKSLS